MRTASGFGLAVLMALPVAGAAQDERFRPPGGNAEAIIYRDAYYSGPAVNVSRPQPNLGLAWQVRAIRVRSGTWELCTRANYNGDCTRISRDTPVIPVAFRGLVSMRPVGYQPPEPPPRPQPNTSLRGMGAEFFPRPTQNGQRVLSCPNGGSTANCAAATADRYCRSAGWNGAAHESQESEGRRVYLADVLCVRSGF